MIVRTNPVLWNGNITCSDSPMMSWFEGINPSHLSLKQFFFFSLTLPAPHLEEIESSQCPCLRFAVEKRACFGRQSDRREAHSLLPWIKPSPHQFHLLLQSFVSYCVSFTGREKLSAGFFFSPRSSIWIAILHLVGIFPMMELTSWWWGGVWSFNGDKLKHLLEIVTWNI